MSWAAPQLLWALVLVPVLIIVFALDGQRRLRVLERLGHVPAFAALTRSLSPARRRLSVILWVLGVSLVLGALSRPQLPGRARLVAARGLDIVVALDFSRSMLARDVYPSRLERAKGELGRLIDNLRGDRVGLVAFAGETMSYPLTTDYDAAKHFWRELVPDDMPVGGTDLGRALKASIDLLKSVERPGQKRKPAQVIILLTDGEDTEGRGIEAAKEAQRLGIRIFTIGIGTTERPIIQTYDENGKPAGYLADDEGKPVRVGLDEGTLRQMAQLGNGQYFALDPERFGIERVEEALTGLQRTEEEARYEREPEDIGRLLLLPGFLLLVAQACFRDRKTQKAPPVEAAEDQARSTGAAGASRRAAAMVLALFLPFVTGFDLFHKKEPSVEKGNQALAAGKPEEALSAYDEALTTRPDDPVIHYNRGIALHALKRYPDAQKEFQRAAESRDPQLKADAYYNLGNAQLANDKAKEAIEAYKHTLQLRPDDKRAKWNLEMALRQMQQQPPPPPQQQPKNDQDKDKNQPKPDDQNQSGQPQDQKQNNQQKPPESGQPDDKNDPQKQNQNQPKPEPQKPDDNGKPDEKQSPQPKPDESAGHDDKKEKGRILPQPKDGREIDKADAEAVLDALERNEPTVQKELARRRAGNRRPKRDW